jgi:hypothetical protein
MFWVKKAMMIDTLNTPRALEKQGLTQSQAEGLAHALKSAVTEGVPTKSDFAELRRDFTGLKGTVNLLAWMVGINITLTLLMLGKLLLTGHQ